MAKYELTDQVVNNIRALIVKSPITWEAAPAVQEALQALSKPIEEAPNGQLPRLE